MKQTKTNLDELKEVKNEKIQNDASESIQQSLFQESSEQDSSKESSNKPRWSCAIISITQVIPGTDLESFIIPTSSQLNYNAYLSNPDTIISFVDLHLALLFENDFLNDDIVLKSVYLSAILDAITGKPIKSRFKSIYRFNSKEEYEHMRLIWKQELKYQQDQKVGVEQVFKFRRHLIKRGI